ncbi:hypothetical protein [Candidatus Oleimmundimicrobium sp.]|uniref:hypothetical protein n=1 Tax=Candidatus Oleimmundimicrobium sp. TaxID=3060597 RepID=UPI00271DE203|nr:hypothetical protein [Candidatus Oleimmundimicrobium sp.]MDO8886817.1 hypothetical protein [Candidatus Oleimmundimicrobium sp.]
MKYLRRPSRKKQFIKFLVPFLFVLGLLYFLGQLGESKPSEFTEYAIQVNKMIRASNETAEGFNELKIQAPTISRAELKARLIQYTKDCADVQEDCASLMVPEELRKIHPYLQLCFEMRGKGMEDYQPAIFNALKDEDLEVATSQVSKALRYLSLSDDAYVLFKENAEEFFREKGVDASLLELTSFDAELAFDKSGVLSFLQELKGIEALEIIHGVAIVELSTNPKQTSYDESSKTAILPEVEEFVVVVTVENQGNQIENNLLVEAILKSEIELEGQLKSVKINSLAPGARKTITIRGLKPTGSGVINLFTVTVGPLVGEKLITNNTREYKFVLK